MRTRPKRQTMHAHQRVDHGSALRHGGRTLVKAGGGCCHLLRSWLHS